MGRDQTEDQSTHDEWAEAISQFASAIGHEFRNALTPIKNGLFFLRGQKDLGHPRVQEFLDIMEREVAASEEMLNGLLEFARIRPSVPRAMMLEGILDQALFDLDIPEAIELTKEISPQLPPAMADPEQIQRVLIHLITNAIEAMPNGGQIEIAAREEGEYLVVKLSDTGCGISPENLPRVFQPLFTTKSRKLGLGLAFSKRIIEQHRGQIEVRSQLGQGTSFIFSLPSAKGDLG